MRRLLSILAILTLVMVCVFVLPTRADAAGAEALAFTLNSDGKSYTVDHLTDYTVTEVTIPSTYNGKPVTEIGACAFVRNEKLTAVTIGNGIVTIGDDAFNGCYNLSSITLPSSLKTIGDGAFTGCSALRSVTIPSSVTSVGERAFIYCESLTTVNIKCNLKTIEASTFEACSNLTNVTIPSTVVNIESFAFAHCYKLSTVTIPSGVTNIGEYAFSECDSLKTIVIPRNVKTLGYGAFCSCDKLATVTISDSFTNEDPIFFDSPVKKLIFSEGTKTISENLVQNKETLEQVTIPSSVTKIENKAFSWCEKLTAVSIPGSVTSIGEDAFEYCSSLTTVTMGEGVKNIGACAFVYCKNLTSVTIPSTVENIGHSVFDECNKITMKTYNNGLYLGNETNPYLVLMRAKSTDITSITIHSKTAIIYTRALQDCTKLTALTIPNGVKQIGFFAVYGCEGLTSVKIPDSVTIIDDCAFYCSFNLETIDVGDGVTTIGNRAFDCTHITSITIGKNVKSIGEGAFEWCHSLKNVYFRGTKAQWDKIAIGASNEPLLNAKLSFVKALKITTQPQTVVVSNGKQAKTTLTATGDGLTYTWYYKNKTASAFAKSSITTNAYTTTMDATRNGRQVYCIVKDKYGNSQKSNVVTLYMGNVAKITKQPASVVASSGATAKASVTASGDGLTYTWYFKNKGASDYSKSSITTNTYSMTMDANRDGRQVYCVVKDKYGTSKTSNVVTLAMKKTAKITKQPKNVLAISGATAKTSVTATGDGLTYTWYFKNKGASSYSKSSITTNTYSMTMDANRNGRSVYCVVKDKYGNSKTSNVVTLTMKKTAKITKQPTNVLAISGATAKTSVTATGDGLTYTWYYKNKGASSYSKSSITTNTYSMTMDANRDGRQVYCVVKDKYGNSKTSNVVTLTMKKTAKITKQPTSTTAESGSKAKITIAATGDGLTYTWYIKNKGATSWNKSSVTGSSYSVTMKETTDGRQVYCVVKDKYGNSVKSNIVTLNMK